MEINLKNGISLKIEGTLGEHHTLPIDDLVNISQSLQNLILSIARYDLPSDIAIDLNNFKIELSDFRPGSAIPSYCFTQRTVPSLFGLEDQREKVSKSFNSLMAISNDGSYISLKEMYREPIIRNEIVESLYEFTSSFKNSPVNIHEKGNADHSYSIKKFKPELKKELISELEEAIVDKKEEIVLAKVQLITRNNKITSKKVKEMFSTEQYSLSYSPTSIKVEQQEYRLNYPIRCLMEEEDN